MLSAIGDRLLLEPYAIETNRKLLEEALERNRWILRRDGANLNRRVKVAQSMLQVANMRATFGELMGAISAADELVSFCEDKAGMSVGASSELDIFSIRATVLKASLMVRIGKLDKAEFLLHDSLQQTAIHADTNRQAQLLQANSYRVLGMIMEMRGPCCCRRLVQSVCRHCEGSNRTVWTRR